MNFVELRGGPLDGQVFRDEGREVYRFRLSNGIYRYERVPFDNRRGQAIFVLTEVESESNCKGR